MGAANGVSGAIVGDAAVEGASGVADPGEIHEECGEKSQGRLEEGPAHGGVSDEGCGAARAHGDALHGGVARDGEIGVGDGGHVDEVEAAEPVEGAEEACGACAEAAGAVEEEGVAGRCVHAHIEGASRRLVIAAGRNRGLARGRGEVS